MFSNDVVHICLNISKCFNKAYYHILSVVTMTVFLRFGKVRYWVGLVGKKSWDKEKTKTKTKKLIFKEKKNIFNKKQDKEKTGCFSLMAKLRLPSLP